MNFPILCLSILLASVASEAELVKVGNLNNYKHGISGEVFVKDQKTLIIKGFSYDGAGPDAFFWAGKSGKPDSVDKADTEIITYPSDGKSYSYEDKNAPILNRAFTNEEIELTLTGDLKLKEIKWLSVWCREFKVNFGDVFFPEDMESELEDIYDDIFDNEVSSVKSNIDWQEPDSESENSSTTLNLSFVIGLLTPILAYFF